MAFIYMPPPSQNSKVEMQNQLQSWVSMSHQKFNCHEQILWQNHLVIPWPAENFVFPWHVATLHYHDEYLKLRISRVIGWSVWINRRRPDSNSPLSDGRTSFSLKNIKSPTMCRFYFSTKQVLLTQLLQSSNVKLDKNYGKLLIVSRIDFAVHPTEISFSFAVADNTPGK